MFSRPNEKKTKEAFGEHDHVGGVHTACDVGNVIVFTTYEN
jgi:hypothetical protein